MRYFLLLPLWLVMELLGKTLWPVLPLFASQRLGPSDNGNSYAVEPRLPRWLAWFDTPDNSLWGDTGWRTIHCVNGWDRYWGMARWLFRNSGTGFSRSVLAQRVYQADITHSGDPHISVDRGVYGLFKANSSHGAWQYKRVLPLLVKSVGLNFGWQMDTMVKNGAADELCHYKFSIKVKRPDI